MNESVTPTAQEEQAARLEAIVRSLADAVVTIDSRGAIDSLNPAAEQLFGYSEEEALGRPFAALLAEPFKGEYAEQLRAHSRGEALPLLGVGREAVGLHRDGSSVVIELIITDLRPMEQRMLVALARDIRERKRAEAQARSDANHDPATGLLDRASFELELTRHVQHAARYGGAGSLLELDVDEFGRAAAPLGPEGATELVNALVALLRTRLRRTDVLARLGPDQLGLLLHAAGPAKARVVADELLEMAREHRFAIGNEAVGITLSAGIASIEGRPVTASELLAEAEVATLAARQAGGDRVVEHTIGGRAATEAQGSWSERVREATEKGLFVLVCQPVTELRSGRIAQYELLLRMRGEDGDLIPPAAFLSTAERFGLIQGVDRWVSRQAVRLIAAHRERGEALTLEVNLSGKTMGDANFVAELSEEIAEAKIDPGRLIFEVGEAAAVAEADAARKLATELRAIGCGFAIDDFGAGIGSLHQLKHLPVTHLKIDGALIESLARSPADQLVVRALVEVCRGLGIETIAEWVSDGAALAFLREVGVDYGQGFFLGHPHPVTDLGEAPSS